MNRTLKTVLALALALALLLGSFAAGYSFALLVGDGASPIVGGKRSSISQVVDEVVGLLRREALEPSSEDSMTAGAVRGLLDSLDDPYADYFDAEHYRYFSQMNDGQFFGIGVTVTVRDGKAIIVSPIDGTPAFEAGLLAEDEIVSVDGYSPEEWTLDEVVARVRGKEGTEVTLDIRRNGSDELLFVTITRARIDVPNTHDELLDGDLGYVRLMSFNTKTPDDLRVILDDLADEGARGFVLDLRDNPGGLLGSSVEVASLFIEDGVIVTVEDRDGSLEEHRASGRAATAAPLVVLVNENSASASEIVAGALQDYERATLVGMMTFGKGSVQTIEELSGGGAVKFTTAHYLTPRGRSIHKRGLIPDVVVEMNPMDQADPETDVQLQRAIEVLRDALD